MIPSSTLLDVSDFFVPHRILTSPVSIHAPTWGATKQYALIGLSLMFQSTLPHGERLRWCVQYASAYRFNPRSHTGSDVQTKTLLTQKREFQSTLPHGERLDVCSQEFYTYSFNPRSHTGSDSGSFRYQRILACFNPRSHTGSDLRIRSVSCLY